MSKPLILLSCWSIAGITEYTDGVELDEIASDPVDFYRLRVQGFSDLNGAIDLLLGRICTPQPPPETRWFIIL